jgi:hypothetical protein
VFVSMQEPSQFVVPSGHPAVLHAPFAHTLPSGHAVPHAPQFCASLCTSVQLPLHSMRGAMQPVVGVSVSIGESAPSLETESSMASAARASSGARRSAGSGRRRSEQCEVKRAMKTAAIGAEERARMTAAYHRSTRRSTHRAGDLIEVARTTSPAPHDRPSRAIVTDEGR